MSKNEPPFWKHAAEALAVLEVGGIPRADLLALREYCAAQSGTIDAGVLIDKILAANQADEVQLAQRLVQTLHTKLAEEAPSVQRLRRKRKVKGFFARLSGNLVGQFILVFIYFLILAAFLVVLKMRWPSMDLYVWGDRFLSLFR
ncbi:MAG TPA: hypothetical protein ENK02_12080 [Planctomycetes bacterium]|nr:hypothetical protein [Planctomycetota bacterium]